MGQESRPMLQRVYGTVWESQEDLDRFLWRREEAKKRDHRRLGVQLDLFSFHDVSPGSAFWHPKGQRLWRTLETAMRELQERHGQEPWRSWSSRIAVSSVRHRRWPFGCQKADPGLTSWKLNRSSWTPSRRWSRFFASSRRHRKRSRSSRVSQTVP